MVSWPHITLVMLYLIFLVKILTGKVHTCDAENSSETRFPINSESKRKKTPEQRSNLGGSVRGGPQVRNQVYLITWEKQMNKLESLLYLSEEMGWAGGKIYSKVWGFKSRVPELNIDFSWTNYSCYLTHNCTEADREMYLELFHGCHTCSD